MERSIFEQSVKGRRAIGFPKPDVEESAIPDNIKRNTEIGLPSVSELDCIRHFTRLSQLNFSVDTHFYPLGSCTMKYNPKINEATSLLDGFANIHPYQDEALTQGALELCYNLQTALAKITGLPYVSLAPNAGAQGEYVGVLMIKKYFEQKNDPRHIAIIPDNAHGTNPASAAMAGFKTVQVKSNAKGTIDIEHLKSLINPDVACIMLTNPNTLGLFETEILEVSKLMHNNGSLLYYDGANLNAIVGKIKPGDMGFDVIHLNLHKSFSTPHGGGGPGSGPVCVSERLKDFLPKPIISRRDKDPEPDVKPPWHRVYNPYNKELNTQYTYFVNRQSVNSIGRIRWFYGNFLILVRAYTYVLSLGEEGLIDVSEKAVLNANYLRSHLEKIFQLTYTDPCLHEFVLSMKDMKKECGISALDIAKRLIDFGIHPPTVYFPLIIPEAVMIEPTETESKATLDEFIAAMKQIYKEAKESPELLHKAPHNCPVGRLDEAKAVKEPKLTL